MDLRVLVAEKVQVYILFYKPSSDDPFLNRLVAFWDGPFCHCEMAFTERVGEEPWDRVVWGSSIYQNEPVFYRQKTYKRDGYASIAIEVTIPQMHRIRSFCRHHAERQTRFSLPAMYAAYLPVQLLQTDATFCSKHVTHALQAGGVESLADANPALMTPSRLYRRLTRTAIVQALPTRMKMVPRRLGEEDLIARFVRLSKAAAASEQQQSQLQSQKEQQQKPRLLLFSF